MAYGGVHFRKSKTTFQRFVLPSSGRRDRKYLNQVRNTQLIGSNLLGGVNESNVSVKEIEKIQVRDSLPKADTGT
jgi:hypothetical protein